MSASSYEGGGEVNELVTWAADALFAARRDRKPIAPIHTKLGERAIDLAYRVQQVNIDRHLGSGDRITGRKTGLTSLAVQKQLGVDQPDFGALLASMELVSGDAVPDTLIQPKAEAEIAFVLEKDLKAEHMTGTEVLNAIAYVTPAIEVVDSAIMDWKFGVVDTIADNASSGYYVLGTERKNPIKLDLRLLGMVLEKNGESESFGAGVACLGHPLRAVQWLARTMVERGTPLRAGDVVLSGALGPMVAAKRGDRFETRIEGLGRVALTFAGGEQ